MEKLNEFIKKMNTKELDRFAIQGGKDNGGSGGSSPELSWDGSYSYAWTDTIGYDPTMDSTRYDTCYD